MTLLKNVLSVRSAISARMGFINRRHVLLAHLPLIWDPYLVLHARLDIIVTKWELYNLLVPVLQVTFVPADAVHLLKTFVLPTHIALKVSCLIVRFDSGP